MTGLYMTQQEVFAMAQHKRRSLTARKVRRTRRLIHNSRHGGFMSKMGLYRSDSQQQAVARKRARRRKAKSLFSF
jgi:hypothetical protein